MKETVSPGLADRAPQPALTAIFLLGAGVAELQHRNSFVAFHEGLVRHSQCGEITERPDS